MRRAFSTRSEAGASGEVLLKRRARSQMLIDARAYYDASLFQGFGSGATAFFGAPPTAPIGSQSYRLWSKLDDAKVNSSRRSTTFDNAIDAATEEPDDEADEDAVAARAYAWNSKALPTLLFAVGVINNIQIVAWRQFLIHGANNGQGLNPAEQAFLGSVISGLPWNLKIFVAFASDVLPICGYRRLTYMAIGFILQGGGWLLLGLLGGSASLSVISAQQFTCTMGQMMVGVMCDALIVESVAMEKGSRIGYLQTTCQIFFALGGLAGTALSGALPQFAGTSYEFMFLLRGIAALAVVLPAILTLHERTLERRGVSAGPLRAASGLGSEAGHRDSEGDEAAGCIGGDALGLQQGVRRCCATAGATATAIWSTMQRLRVFYPLVFIFVFAASPGSSDAFNTYLLQQTPLCQWVNTSGLCLDASASAADLSSGDSGSGDAGAGNSGIADWCAQYSSPADALTCSEQWGGLGFSDMLYATFGLLGSAGSVLGNFLFRHYLLSMNWHKLFATTVLVASAAGTLQLFLMFRLTSSGQTLSERLHLPAEASKIAFALGDDVIVSVANQLLAMPILVLMARLCPPGAEGTTYAIVTSVQAVGGTVGGVISQHVIAAFGVTNTDFTNLWQLTLVTALAKLIALPLLPLVPSAASLDSQDERRSILAGFTMLLIFTGGLGWALAQVFLTLL